MENTVDGRNPAVDIVNTCQVVGNGISEPSLKYNFTPPSMINSATPVQCLMEIW